MTILTLVGCNTRTVDGPNGDDDYRWTGFMVKDYNLNRFEASGRLAVGSDSSVAGATITLNDDTLLLETGRYGFEVSPATAVLPGVYLLSLEDSTGLDVSVAAPLPSGFNIAVSDPANRINNGGDQVSIDWSGASQADGYVLATVAADSAYTGQGYSLWIGNQGTGGTIPPDAFRWKDGINPDTGWYYIYVYAFSDAPDSALSAMTLPCPLPGQLPDDIDQHNFVGRFGGISVALRDSVRVAIQ
ncbi:MAG: hypothetical protein ABIE70_00405 [bacterium]